ncbi:dihydropyrimidine dehydrogenase subunit A [Marivirga tractuosa]|uniref:Glutamate synthase (NADH) small subunit n=1 Tax=Marivirga tractuosa (strain ATCC 23168 / DSM 4126 / NBRC 15989 / NCIMB 1408 / VKM B-1430 / H-43) TaxID=643867 RepID=E4TNT8_MARTH|nr:glutamate synthase subunit beta [Marivirga tractuosa]ADR22502.1 glutamate synthase (NADH) small subunit [Marivirga tractuosa DSM 4126]BDD16827.1 dihydropyrimidine dehydrogenase subunit A [Marivirga tractuosa]
MGQQDGFLKFDRELPDSRSPKKRVEDFKEIYQPFPEVKTKKQAARCMDCGIPFCHSGCPLGNIIPEFNDAVYRENWEEAAEILYSTNNFPEFTGRICPAPCEASCVLGINKPAVAIEHIEKTIAEKAYELGYIKADPPQERTGKKVAVIGSGPAGLAAADQLNKAGHWVTVFERETRIGGLLRYGIPDFKLEKQYVERRINIMDEEGVRFKVNAEVGKNINPDMLKDDFDSIVICTGSTVPRDLPIPGRDLTGIEFAMDFLTMQNKEVAGDEVKDKISAHGKNVVVIGGGDTGSDCIGTSHRQHASSVLQLELMPKPPQNRGESDPWPLWPMTLRTSSSHEEGGERKWGVLTKEFKGNEKGQLTHITLVDIEWVNQGGRQNMQEIQGTERDVPCELALLAIGFTQPENHLLESLGVHTTQAGTVEANHYKTNVDNIFTAGDARRGQSLVVWAISEGREAAREVDQYLMGKTELPAKDDSFFNVASSI